MSNTSPSRQGRSWRNLRPYNWSLPGIGALALLLGSASLASQGANIAITPISNNTAAYPNAISHNGHVAGDFDLGTYDSQGNPITHAFLYFGGQPTELPLLTTPSTNLTARGLGVNDTGTVVGWGRAVEAGPPHAFRYTAGQTTDLNDTLGAAQSVALAVNNNGQILCFVNYAAGGYGTVILNPDQSQIAIPNVLPFAINSSGHVVGSLHDQNDNYVPVFFADTNSDGQAESNEIHHLGTLAGGALGNPNLGGVALNDSDKIVGSLKDSNGTSHALLWPSGADGQAPTDLGTIGAETGGAAVGINSAGHVVGFSGSGDPFYWPGSGALQQLNALVSESQSASYILYYVNGISDGDLLIGAAAPHQVPPPIGVTIQLGGQPVNNVSLKSVSVPSSVTSPSKLVVAVTMDKKVGGSGVDVAGAYVIGVLNTAFTIHVPANSKTGAVELDTPLVTQDTTARITVSYNGTSLPSKTVTIHPAPIQPAVNGLSVSPNPVHIGQKFTASLTLTAPVAKTTTIPVGIFSGDNPTGSGSPLFVVKVKLKKSQTGSSVTAVAPRGTPTGTYTAVAAFGGAVQHYQFSVSN